MFKSFTDFVKSFGLDSDTLLANRYQIINQIGRGAMGQVYKAIDQQSGNTTVAIKFLSQALSSKKMLRRFETEAKISALLGEQSDYIVKVKDYGLIDNKTPFYVMEYLEGDDLDHVIKYKTISIAKFLYLIRQVCLGLECAHNGILINEKLATIIHRDIKPSNIFLAKDKPKKKVCKILDFGIAQIHDPDKGQLQEKFMGTPEYCSPEQMAEESLEPTSDIYSLGVLMYQMLTKTTPITAENRSFQAWYRAHHETKPKTLPRYIQLPKEIENLIMRCLAKSPSDRPQSIIEILRVISPLEREYNYNDSAQQEQKKTMSFVAKQEKTREILPLKISYLQSNWPRDKPQQKIVFPCLIEAKEGFFCSLWTMLEPEEVKIFNPKSTFCFNHFLFQLNPHPMILWINLLYERNHEPKLLPCYLDLKTEIGYQIANNLVAQGLYHILLFELLKTNKYEQLLKMKITEEKINKIDKFITKSSSIMSDNDKSKESKIALKKQFDTVKDTIIAAIEKVQSY